MGKLTTMDTTGEGKSSTWQERSKSTRVVFIMSRSEDQAEEETLRVGRKSQVRNQHMEMTRKI